MPSLQRSSLYLAAQAQSELIHAHPSASAGEHKLCLQNIQAAVETRDMSAAECRAYFTIASQLGDYSNARRFLDRWENLAPNDTALAHQRIELEIMAENYSAALRMFDTALAHAPTDSWVLARRETVLDNLKHLIHSVPHETPSVVK
jgi:tetratricopeptide (TPR) repeat protein